MDDYGADWKNPPKTLKKKAIMCSTTKCEEDMHLFKTNMRKKAAKLEKMTYRSAGCICCNKELVDWERIDERNLDDVEYLFNRLKLEAWRKKYWEIDVEENDLDKAKKKGLRLLRKEIRKRIEKSLGPPSHKIFQDGRQTPKVGNIIFYAQHATGTCCRKCTEEWYGIDRKKSLKKKDKEYLEKIIFLYIKKKCPTVKEEGLLEEPIIKK